jgi:hypothetical protein
MWQPASAVLGGEHQAGTAVLVMVGDGYLHAIAESATPEPPVELSWYVLPLEQPATPTQRAVAHQPVQSLLG